MCTARLLSSTTLDPMESDRGGIQQRLIDVRDCTPQGSSASMGSASVGVACGPAFLPSATLHLSHAPLPGFTCAKLVRRTRKSN